MKINNCHSKNALDKICDDANKLGFYYLDQSKVHLLCLPSLIYNIIQHIQLYVRVKSQQISFADFIIQYFVHSVLLRFQNMKKQFVLIDWKKLLDLSGQLKLYLTFVEKSRGRSNILKYFLKIRKQIMKGRVNTLDQIYMNHAEIIAVLHRLFPDTIRKQIQKKMNDLHLIHPQKQLQSTILIEFLIQRYQQAEQNLIQFKLTSDSRFDKNNSPKISKINSTILTSKTKDLSTQRGFSNRNSQSILHQNNNNLNSSSSKYIKVQRSSKSQKGLQNYEINQQFSDQKILKKYSQMNSSQSFNQNSKLLLSVESPSSNYDLKDFCFYTKKCQQLPTISYIRQKYSQDWSRMLQINEQFKHRVLQKTRKQIHDIYRYQQKQQSVQSQQQFQDCLNDGFSFQIGNQKGIKQQQINQSPRKRHMFFNS